MRPWPEGARSVREEPAMPTVDLTPRLARQSKPGPKDTFLFDCSLPGFGLRIHPSGRKVYIVQARIEGRSRRIAIARHGEMELAEARRRARDMLARIRAGENPADEIRREKETPIFREFSDEYLRRSDPHWKPSGRKTVRIYLNPTSATRTGFQLISSDFDRRPSCKGLVSLMGGVGKTAVVPTLALDLACDLGRLWLHVRARQETFQRRQRAPLLERGGELPQPRRACGSAPSAVSG